MAAGRFLLFLLYLPLSHCSPLPIAKIVVCGPLRFGVYQVVTRVWFHFYFESQENSQLWVV